MELDEPPVVDGPVDHRHGHLVVSEHRVPSPNSTPGLGDDRRLPLVGVGKHWKSGAPLHRAGRGLVEPEVHLARVHAEALGARGARVPGERGVAQGA